MKFQQTPSTKIVLATCIPTSPPLAPTIQVQIRQLSPTPSTPTQRQYVGKNMDDF